jgi:hypothetical protein
MPPNDKAQKLARIIAGRVSQLKPEKIDEVRSTLDQFMGWVTSDTLSQLRQAVAEHEAAPAAGWQARVDGILRLCDAYLAGEGKEPGNRKKADAVETIKAEALVEQGRRLAEAQYLADAYQKDPATALQKQTQKTIDEAHPAAQDLGQGVASGGLGADADALKLVQESGLTEAEVLAVKTYTSDDYTYINPATANSQSWMEANQFKDQVKADPDYLKTDDGRKQMRILMEEGSLQAAMVVAALQKLEPKSGTCYRGERMTPKEFEDTFGDATSGYKLPARTRNNLTSIARVKAAAQSFANRHDDDTKTVSVMWEVAVTNGREIRDLSVYGKGEAEWLLLPGTVLQATEVTEESTGAVGSPAATKWATVKFEQQA